jgi:hypothetical protein
MVMLIFGGDGLKSVVTEKWQGKVKFDQPTDIGDVAACAKLGPELVQRSPNNAGMIHSLDENVGRIMRSLDKLKLLNDLRQWRKEVGAQMPTINPNYDPARMHQWKFFLKTIW